jgi:alcohol dehydrogenase class IV
MAAAASKRAVCTNASPLSDKQRRRVRRARRRDAKPRLSLVHEGIDLCRREQVDFILAVGGGSVIDSSKAIAMGVYYDGDVWNLYESGAAIERGAARRHSSHDSRRAAASRAAIRSSPTKRSS